MIKRIIIGVGMLLMPLNIMFGGDFHHLEVDMESKTTVEEPLDFTIKVFDKENSIVADFTGSMVAGYNSYEGEIKESDVEFKKGGEYSFSLSDEGEKIIKDGVTFNSTGEVYFYISSKGSDKKGGKKITIEEEESYDNGYIKISSPKEGENVDKDIINLIGDTSFTEKKIHVYIDGEKMYSAIPSDNGNFNTYISLSDIKAGNHTLSLNLIDDSGNIVFEGESVDFNYKADSDNVTENTDSEVQSGSNEENGLQEEDSELQSNNNEEDDLKEKDVEVNSNSDEEENLEGVDSEIQSSKNGNDGLEEKNSEISLNDNKDELDNSSTNSETVNKKMNSRKNAERQNKNESLKLEKDTHKAASENESNTKNIGKVQVGNNTLDVVFLTVGIIVLYLLVRYVVLKKRI